MNDFTLKALEISKSRVDPYIKEAREKGYRDLDYGVPKDAYNQVFGGIKTTPEEASTKNGEISFDDWLNQ